MKNKNSAYLMLLCWLAYSCAYVGKLSYSANINQIGTAWGVSYAEAGMVSTFFFFVYGAGQIVNGLLCKKYNIKYVIFTALAVSSVMNLLVAVVPSFEYIKYIWLVNGASMSFLWTSLIRLLSETLPKSYIPKATVVMGTTVATGTTVVYGVSTVFAATATYHATFIFASVLLILIALIWLVSFTPLTKPLLEERAFEISELREKSPDAQKAEACERGILVFIGLVALFAVADNFVKDGLTSWTPDILASLYETPDWLSILLTLLLPILAIFGSFVAVSLQKITKNFVLSIIILFTLSSLLIGTVILFITSGVLPLTIGCFALVSCLMAGVNNVITSMIPLEMNDKISSGKLAGILNGFCYLGSTASSYGLGLIADNLGWHAVFYFLLGANLISVTAGLIYVAVKKINHKNNATV